MRAGDGPDARGGDADGGDDDALGTDYASLATELAERDAVGFVAVGDRFDDDLRWLTRFSGPDRNYAFVATDAPGSDSHGDDAGDSGDDPDESPDGDAAGDDTATDDLHTALCAPALFDEQARREFPGEAVLTDRQGDHAGVRAAAALSARGVDGGTVLVPQSIPHDAAVYLSDAGYEVASTDAIARARRTKTDAEIDRLRRVQRAAIRGVARAEAILAEATPDPDADDGAGAVRWNGGALSTERLRRQVNEVLAAHGVRDAGNTVIGAGATAADLHYTGTDAIRPGETVLLDVSPRGPDGYYGDVTRTFAVDPDGGWERRAYLAVERAREAALAEVAAGVPASTVHEEAAAELAAHGFRVDSDAVGFTHSTGHGVGVSLHEGPSLSADEPLAAGDVVTIEPGVYDPGEGGVRLEDLIVVADDGYDLLGEYPFSLVPRRREGSQPHRQP
ncbi:M24 family metallopeptidase [Halobaculum sp. CBA1158]|uniref:M24 family metallopeptidase n=1 Tax=Halobaculum sp. CBA1158 TaxID=2904243 RepID=UPI001F27D81C|nr:M24 family metallopeptidase [Halobaculum sp. CBA1158]UIP00526.1 M24 family metallopeptidase [Halobaculum sp. CBA1158]